MEMLPLVVRLSWARRLLKKEGFAHAVLCVDRAQVVQGNLAFLASSGIPGNGQPGSAYAGIGHHFLSLGRRLVVD